MSSTSHNNKRYSATFTLILFGTLGWLAWSVFAFAFIGDIGYEIKEPGLHTQPRETLQTPLRFAMLHDVIHQRFKKHGTAWHQARIVEGMFFVEMYRDETTNNVVLDQLIHFDDVAVAYERLGNPDAGLDILEEKRAHLLRLGPEPTLKDKRYLRNIIYFYFEDYNKFPNHEPNSLELAWYRYYANAGTLMVHKHMKAAMQGDAVALAGLEKADVFIRKSIALNPQAHFGREVFQLMAIENLRYLINDPFGQGLWTIFGYSIDNPNKSMHQTDRRGRKPRDKVPHIGVYNFKLNGELHLPFDELSVGIMGMWLYGGGANPHFAMNLGIIMEHIGQRRIAWTAYRRAISMKDRFWPDKDTCNKLAMFCDTRMTMLEESIGPDARQKLEQAYLSDLQKGLNYQEAQAAYEAKQIQKGVSIRDESFFDAFHKQHGPIASPIGRADLVTISKTYRYKDLMMDFQVLFILLGALLGYYLYFKTSLLDKQID